MVPPVENAVSALKSLRLALEMDLRPVLIAELRPIVRAELLTEMDSPDCAITRLKVAELLGIGETKLDAIVRMPGFPRPRMVGQHKRWKRSEVWEWFDSQSG